MPSAGGTPARFGANKMPRTYENYLSHKSCQCDASHSFRYSLYQTIERGDMRHRRLLSLAFPDEVAEVLKYEGHAPFDRYPPVWLNLLCDVQKMDKPDFESMYCQPQLAVLRNHVKHKLRPYLDLLERAYQVTIDAPISLPGEDSHAEHFAHACRDQWLVEATLKDDDDGQFLFLYAIELGDKNEITGHALVTERNGERSTCTSFQEVEGIILSLLFNQVGKRRKEKAESINS